MSRSLSLLMALMALVAFEAFLFPGLALAQKERCTQTVYGEPDSTCTDTDQCLATEGCTMVRFKAQCSGAYTIDAWTTCENIHCKHCQSCVNVYDSAGTTFIEGGNCHLQDCVRADCDQTCAGFVHLTAGVWYTLWVCLLPCVEEEGCGANSCNSSCSAHGCLRIGSVAPCY